MLGRQVGAAASARAQVHDASPTSFPPACLLHGSWHILTELTILLRSLHEQKIRLQPTRIGMTHMVCALPANRDLQYDANDHRICARMQRAGYLLSLAWPADASALCVTHGSRRLGRLHTSAFAQWPQRNNRPKKIVVYHYITAFTI